MTDKTTAAQPSSDPAPNSAATDTSTTDNSTTDDSDKIFAEYAAQSNARLAGLDKIDPVGAGTAGEDPGGGEAATTNTETPSKEGVSTSGPGKDAASTDAASKEGKQQGNAPQEPTDAEILASVPEHLRGKVESRLKAEEAARKKSAELEDANKDLEQKYRSEQGRVAALKAQPKVAPKKEATPADKAEWEKFEKRYPDVAKGMKSLFALKGGDPENMKDVLEYVTQQRDKEALQIGWKAVEERHPGSRALARTKDFQAWLGSESQKVQQWADSSDPEDAVLLFDRYYAARPDARAKPAASAQQEATTTQTSSDAAAKAAAAIAERRRLQQDGARSPSGKGGAQPNTQLDPNDGEALFNFYAKQSNARLSRLGH